MVVKIPRRRFQVRAIIPTMRRTWAGLSVSSRRMRGQGIWKLTMVDYRALGSTLLILFIFFIPVPVLSSDANPFEDLEEKLLGAEGISMNFELSSDGAVVSSLTGSLSLCRGNRASIRSSGQVFGQKERIWASRTKGCR